MPDIPTTLVTPPLRPIWSAAKKTAEAKAKELKEDAKFADLAKRMKDSLGPDLEAWPKDYPKFDKLKTNKTKIDTTIHNYSETLKNAPVNANVKKPLTDALAKIKKAMDERLVEAKEHIDSDLKLGIKESQKKQHTPLIIFNQDIAKQVNEKAPKANLEAEKLLLEVILSDDKVLKNIPEGLDDPVLAKELREAANFHLVIEQLAKLMTDCGASVKSDKDVPAAEHKFEQGMDKIIEECLNRTAKPVFELTGVRSDYKMYKIKQAASLGASIAGAVGGVVGLAITPFTGGASTILGIISLINAGITIGRQLATLSEEAEGLINRVAVDINTLNKQYESASKTLVGVGEMGKTLVNSTFGPALTTIKGCKGDCDTVTDKINGLTVKTHDEAQDLGKMLTEQSKLQKQLSEFERISKPQLEPAEIQKFTLIDKAVDASAKSVEKLIKDIETLDKRVATCKVSHKILAGALGQIAAKEPTWAQVGEILISAVVAAGFMVGGNVNTPDPYKCLELVDKINTGLGDALSTLTAASSAAGDLNDLIKKRSKK
jgi:hypothetical protein